VSGALVAVIENDEVVSEGMRVLLEGWGCEIVSAFDGDDVVRSLGERRRWPGLLVADYHLDDGRTGVQAIAQVREAAGSPIPGIIITADRSPEVLRLVRSSGFFLLNKPIRPAKLRALMSHILA
ncbi:MAG: response regulator, partial [Rhodospirillales bacterium]|nr:response regulator [Rhodospirillales bacterium]